jgi:hypothetical protein
MNVRELLNRLDKISEAPESATPPAVWAQQTPKPPSTWAQQPSSSPTPPPPWAQNTSPNSSAQPVNPNSMGCGR